MRTIILLLAIFSTSLFNAQELEKNEIDEFTGNKIKNTSWEVITRQMSADMSFRFCQIDSLYSMNIKFMKPTLGTPSYYSVSAGSEFYLKLNDNKVIKAYASKDVMSCFGCGATGFSGSAAMGIDVYFVISKDDLEILSKQSVSKIRFVTNSGKVEFDLQEKKATRILKAADLILKN